VIPAIHATLYNLNGDSDLLPVLQNERHLKLNIQHQNASPGFNSRYTSSKRWMIMISRSRITLKLAVFSNSILLVLKSKG